MSDFYVYILFCSDRSYYTGQTDDLEKRIAEHREGMCKYTRKRLPINVVFVQTFSRRDDALAAERQIKGWSRAKKEAMIKGDQNSFKNLSKCRSRKY